MKTIFAAHTRSCQSGLTIVELLIAVFIGLVIVTGVIQVFISSKQTYRVQDNLSRLQENGRFALEVLGNTVRIAGFKGNLSTSPELIFTTATYFTNSTFAEDQVITGTDAATGTPDTLVVRYMGDTSTTLLDCSGGAVAPGIVVVSRLFLNGNSLTCLSTTNATPLALVDDVLDMQVTYGMTTDLNALHDVRADCYLDASTVITTPATNCVSGLNFNQVVSIRISLLLTTPDDNLTPDNQTQTYSFNGVTTTSTDRRLYRELTKTIALRNLIL